MSKKPFTWYSPRKKNTHNFEIKIGNNILTRVHEAKYLGVIIDDRLSWKSHVAKVKSKMARGCWAMSRLKQYVSPKVLTKIYYSLVYSQMQYCISCWGWIAKCNLSSVFVLQKRAIRIICGVSSRTHTTPLFHKLKFLKLSDIYFLHIAKIMHKFSNNHWSGQYKIKPIQEIHSYFTRSSTSNFYPRLLNSKMSRGALSAAGPKIWSNVPVDLKSLNFCQFKYKLKQHLVNRYRPS